jgi:hypothetical protein
MRLLRRGKPRSTRVVLRLAPSPEKVKGKAISTVRVSQRIHRGKYMRRRKRRRRWWRVEGERWEKKRRRRRRLDRARGGGGPPFLSPCSSAAKDRFAWTRGGDAVACPAFLRGRDFYCWPGSGDLGSVGWKDVRNQAKGRIVGVVLAEILLRARVDGSSSEYCRLPFSAWTPQPRLRENKCERSGQKSPFSTVAEQGCSGNGALLKRERKEGEERARETDSPLFFTFPPPPSPSLTSQRRPPRRHTETAPFFLSIWPFRCRRASLRSFEKRRGTGPERRSQIEREEGGRRVL